MFSPGSVAAPVFIHSVSCGARSPGRGGWVHHQASEGAASGPSADVHRIRSFCTVCKSETLCLWFRSLSPSPRCLLWPIPGARRPGVAGSLSGWTEETRPRARCIRLAQWGGHLCLKIPASSHSQKMISRDHRQLLKLITSTSLVTRSLFPAALRGLCA